MSSITLNPYQYEFIDTLARYPALIAGVGTGKTLCGIIRMVRLMEMFPGNIGMIVRKTHVDLTKSTILDFTGYTGIPVVGDRKATFQNGSVILFRHGVEVNPASLKNINLGAFYIEQAEEYENDVVFEYLAHRIRRQRGLKGDPIGYRSGFIIANSNGHNWIWRKWIDKPVSNEFKCWQANTYDNAHNLPDDFIKDLKEQELRSPEFYQRYVMNDHEVVEASQSVITYAMIEQAKKLILHDNKGIRTIGFDPSLGGDEAVIYCLIDGYPVDCHVFHEKDPMILTSHCRMIDSDFKAEKIGIDHSGGLGEAIGSRLRQLYPDNEAHKVVVLNSSTSIDSTKHFNLKINMWWEVRERFQNKTLRFPLDDDKLEMELTSVKFSTMNASNKVKLELKERTKKRIGKSPDRADAYVYGVWALKLCEAEYNKKVLSDYDEYLEMEDDLYAGNKRESLRAGCL